MNNPAEVINIENEKQLTILDNALTVFNIQETVLSTLENSTRLEITGAESEKMVRKHRQNTKSIQVKVEKRRLKLNRSFKEETDQAAGIIQDRLEPVYTNLDAKVRAVEKIKNEKKEKEMERLDNLDSAMEILKTACRSGLTYNLVAKEIHTDLERLQTWEFPVGEYQERTKEAKDILSKGIAGTGAALAARIIFENEQASQEKERKKLAEDKAEFEKKRVAEREKQAQLDAERKKEADRKQAIQDWFNQQQQETADCININDVTMYNTYIASLRKAVVRNFGDREQEALGYINAVIVSMIEKRDGLLNKIGEEAEREEKAAQEAETLRLREKQIEDDRKSLEKKEADIKAKESRRKEIQDCFDDTQTNITTMIADGDIEPLTKYTRFLESDELFFNTEFFGDRYHEMKSFNLVQLSTAAGHCHPFAIEDNNAFDNTKEKDAKATEKNRKAKLADDKKRAKLVKYDKAILFSIANDCDKHISITRFGKFKTKEAEKMAVALVGILKGTIHAFEESARELV